MKKYLLILLLSILVLTSCQSAKTIYYQYNGVTITRIDRGNEIFFYYGKLELSKDLENEPYIRAWYKGLNSGMGAYLIFKSDKSIEIRRIYDSFEEVGNNSHLRLTEYMENYKFIEWQDSIKGKFENVVYVSDIIENEKIKNVENNSKVKAIYSTR